MTNILIDDIEVTLDISFKKNKNTYFRFYPDNVIKVSASKHQSMKDIKKYIQTHKVSFLKKLDTVNNKTELDPSKYHLFGEGYKKVELKGTKFIQFYHDEQTVFVPDIDIDLLDNQFKKHEKELLLTEIQNLIEKYQNNSYINLDGATFKTRRMKSRYGSCNKIKRRININLKLVHYNKKFLEYVFAHEICHLVVANHQKAFYDLLHKIYPNYKEVRKELKTINIR